MPHNNHHFLRCLRPPFRCFDLCFRRYEYPFNADPGYVKADAGSEGERASKSQNWARSTTIWRSREAEEISKLVGEIKNIFLKMNDGEISASAYDTAWVAMVPSVGDSSKPQFPSTLGWVLKNQNKDGSWGEPGFFLLYDRLICTLACIVALKKWVTGEDLVVRGIHFLRSHIPQLGKESNSLRTVGFEVIFPSMLNEARNLGIDLPYNIPFLKEIFRLREKKINGIPLEILHTVPTTLLHSLEALQEVVQWEKILKLQSRDGSLLASASSTALVYMKTGDKKCLEFLNYIVSRFGDYAACQYPVDIYERLWVVDTIQRLGIDHHFSEEISRTLDYVYRSLGEHGLSWGSVNPVPDIDDTCMGLRLLRLFGYPVSSDILKNFKDNDGNFVCFPGQSHKGVSDMFNLYRCSQVSFPGDKILEEAKAFVEPYLWNCIEKNQVDDKWTLKKALNKEIDHALRYQWKMSLPRVETREYIKNYGEADLWIGKTVYWMHNINEPKYLELAKLDYNILQSIHIRERNYIMKWWNDSGFQALFFTRMKPQEIHFSIAASVYEQQYSACRIAYTKCVLIEDVIRNIFESHESISNLRVVCQAVEEWNPALLSSLPNELKIAFMEIYDLLNVLATAASDSQGKDMFPYLHGIRLMQIQEYMKIRENKKVKSFSSLREYLEYSKTEVGVAIRVLPAMFLMGNRLENYILQFLDHRSKIQGQLALLLTLLQDVYTYKNLAGWNSPNAIHFCMKENNYTRDEALQHLKGAIDDAFAEVVYECLKPSHVPRSARRLMFEHARIAQFFLTDDVDLKCTRNEMVKNALVCLYTPV